MNTPNRTQIAKYTYKDFESEFPDNDACLKWLKDYRFPDGIRCPVCDKITKHHKITKRPCFKCDNCGHEVYPLAGTIFHKSATPLKTWMEAIFWMATTRSGHSAKELQRRTGVTYKTAWRMFRQIRSLLGENTPTLIGEVEVDETYVGGVRRGKRGRGAEGKVSVIGVVQRQGKVIATAVPNVKRSTIVPFVTSHVAPDAVLYTDEFPSYDHITRFGYKHHRIQHSAKVYVAGRVHTNNIENFWSLIKRGISGVYHAVSPKYLQSYLNEYAFRYNHRKDETPMFKLFLNQI
jgi:transposase-like protein